MKHKPLLQILLMATCIVPAIASHAACNNPLAPAVSPGLSRGLEIRFRPHGASAPVFEPASVSQMGELQLPRVLLDPGTLKNEPFNAEGGAVVYLESGGKGEKRLCRKENWERRPPAGRHPDGDPYPIDGEQAPAHPALLRVFPYYYLKSIYSYYYDDHGRLSEVRLTRTANRSVGADLLKHYYRQNGLLYCARYDEQGRLYAETGAKMTMASRDPAFKCSELGNDPAHTRVEYFSYNTDGSFSAQLSKTPSRKAGEDSSKPDTGFGTQITDGDWYGEGQVYLQSFAQKNERASAYLHYSQNHGLTNLRTDYFDLIPSDAQALFAQRSTYGGLELHYTFPGEPVPLSVVTGNLEGITGYTRVRRYVHRSGSTIFEVFDPNRNIPRQRLWVSSEINRQEDYDAQGRLKRVINSGPPSSEGYTENLRAYADSGVLKLTPRTAGYASYRVYDYDASGKETLSLVCWAHETPVNRPYDHFPWWQADPRPKLRNSNEESIYRMRHISNNCGTPDGKATVIGMGPADLMMRDRYGFGTTKLRIPRD